MLWGRLCIVGETGPIGRVTGRRVGEVGDTAVAVLWVAELLVGGGGMLS